MTPRQELAIHVMMYAMIAFSIWVLAHAWATITVLVGRTVEWVAYADDPDTFRKWVLIYALSIPLLGWFLWALKYRRRRD
ncbi:hypothetical protein EB232_17465 [Mesorhizobium sp. NZP2077]|nr:hypothetical protein EB232_17465 [Mesorhizobium sp. NZP2077]